jgi:hypothetical protein
MEVKEMKKLTLLFVAIVLLLALVPAVFANPYPVFETDLTAGGGNPKSAMLVGKVKVKNDGQYLYVKYDTDKGWCLTETHLHVFVDPFNDVPHKNGNPIPGQFDYSGVHDCVTQGDYKIPNVWAPGTTVYIAAHAVVCKCDCAKICVDTKCECSYECECSDECETAWGGDYFGNPMEFPGKNWAIFFAYTIQ